MFKKFSMAQNLNETFFELSFVQMPFCDGTRVWLVSRKQSDQKPHILVAFPNNKLKSSIKKAIPFSIGLKPKAFAKTYQKDSVSVINWIIENRKCLNKYWHNQDGIKLLENLKFGEGYENWWVINRQKVGQFKIQNKVVKVFCFHELSGKKVFRIYTNNNAVKYCIQFSDLKIIGNKKAVGALKRKDLQMSISKFLIKKSHISDLTNADLLLYLWHRFNKVRLAKADIINFMACIHKLLRKNTL